MLELSTSLYGDHIDILVHLTRMILNEMKLFEILNNTYFGFLEVLLVATWFETGNVCFISPTSNKDLLHCPQRKKAKRVSTCRLIKQSKCGIWAAKVHFLSFWHMI